MVAYEAADDPITAYSIGPDGAKVEIGMLSDLVAESKTSVCGYVTITFRMKQSRSKTSPARRVSNDLWHWGKWGRNILAMLTNFSSDGDIPLALRMSPSL